MLRSVLTLTVAVCSLSLVAGCESGQSAESMPDSSASMGMLNDKCPVMGGDVEEGDPAVSYGAYQIGFCCEGCVGKWEAMDAAAKDAFVAKYTE